jgi:prepilin-type N-terminal cleavage/methylation domain-containing protein
MNQSRGFTLIEVVIAAFILAVAVLALLGLQLTSAKSSAKARELRAATSITENILQSVRSAAVDDITGACPSEDEIDGLSVGCRVVPCAVAGDELTCSAAVSDPQVYDVVVTVSKDNRTLVSTHTYVHPAPRLGDVENEE